MSVTSMQLPALSVSSIESYIGSVNRIAMLTPEREHELGVRLKRDGDLQAASELVLSHLRLVVSTARNYLGYGLPHADLIQEGNIGLMKAVKRFDPDRGVRLVSFAIHWIKAEIHEYILKNWRMVKIATTKAQRKLFFNLRSMKPHFGSLSPKELQDVARQLNVKESEVAEMEQRLTGQEISLEPLGEESDDWISPIAYLRDAAQEPAHAIQSAQREKAGSDGLRDALAQLDERSRRIISARWLSEGEEKTLHELADEFGVSAERIRQVEAKAMQKMKLSLARYAAA